MKKQGGEEEDCLLILIRLLGNCSLWCHVTPHTLSYFIPGNCSICCYVTLLHFCQSSSLRSSLLPYIYMHICTFWYWLAKVIMFPHFSEQGDSFLFEVADQFSFESQSLSLSFSHNHKNLKFFRVLVFVNQVAGLVAKYLVSQLRRLLKKPL